MRQRKNILSFFLLAIYLLAVLHNGITNSREADKSESTISVSLHQHNDFKTVHHEHQFHVGIFHFLGHLFENIDYSNDQANEHIVVVQKRFNEKVIAQKKNANSYSTSNKVVAFNVNLKSEPDPPAYSSLLLSRSKQLNTPLRAPPAAISS